MVVAANAAPRKDTLRIPEPSHLFFVLSAMAEQFGLCRDVTTRSVPCKRPPHHRARSVRPRLVDLAGIRFQAASRDEHENPVPCPNTACHWATSSPAGDKLPRRCPSSTTGVFPCAF